MLTYMRSQEFIEKTVMAYVQTVVMGEIGMVVCTYKVSTRISQHWLVPFFGPVMRHIFAF